MYPFYDHDRRLLSAYNGTGLTVAIVIFFALVTKSHMLPDKLIMLDCA